jgi:hypothetical protein
MQVQYDNRLVTSFMLFLDHEVQRRGQAYTNYSGRFYKISGNRADAYTYAPPYKQLCNDTSISGANVMSGVYLNNNLIKVGQSGLKYINHYEGTVYFTGGLPNNSVLSGNYAIKEFNIRLTNKADWKLLFETKYVTNSKYNQILSGLPIDTETSPAIYIKVKDTKNIPFAFKSMDDNVMQIRTVVVADNEFEKVGVCNILKNLSYRPINIINRTPFDSLGNMTGVNYNYDNLSVDSSYLPWIMAVKVIDVPQRGDYKDINKNTAIVDFELSTVMRHT